MKKVFLSLFVLFLIPIGIYAQIDAFASEITYRNNMAYYNGQAFTGTVYSDEEVEIPNDCQCSLKATYKNGLLNGLKQEWYYNGKLKFKGNYVDNQPTGTHTYYEENGDVFLKKNYQNGKLIKETYYYPGGKIKNETPFANGQKQGIGKTYDQAGNVIEEVHFDNDKIVKTIQYKNGQKQKEIIYGPTHQIHKIFKNGQLIKEQSIENKSLGRDGLTKIYDEAGLLIEEINYVNGRIKSYKSFKNNLKDGEWYDYNQDFTVKTIKNYKDDQLIDTKIIDTHLFVSNFPLQQHDQVLQYYNPIEDNFDYYILRINNNHVSSKNNVIPVVEKIKSEFYSRATLLPKENYQGERIVKGIIEVKDLRIKTRKEQRERYKTQNGVQRKYYVIAYDTDIRFVLNHKKPDERLINSYNLSFDSQGNLGNALLSAVVGAFPKTPQEAYKRTLSNIKLNKVLTNILPITARVEATKKSGSKIKYIQLDKGIGNGLHKKMLFSIYDKDNKQKIGKIKVYKVDYSSAVCKIISDKSRVQAYLNNHPDAIVIETK